MIKNQQNSVPPLGIASLDPSRYVKPSEEELKKTLSPLQYAVTQEADTERPFSGKYNNHYEKGIYVDITTGEPLFASTDKFESGCGWPSFSRPIHRDLLRGEVDASLGMVRIEIRSRVGDAHLGHVFEDGPIEKGGYRFCINSAALQFIPLEEMEQKGYGDLKSLVK